MVRWKRYSLLIFFLALINLAFAQGWLIPQDNLSFPVVQGAQTIEIEFKIREGIHINSNTPESNLMIPTKLEAEWPAGITAGDIIYSETQPFQLSGVSYSFEVFHDAFSVRIPLEILSPVDSVKIPLRITYQPCDHRKCYFPRKQALEIVLVGNDVP